jgi:hypothetical protein
MPGPGAVMPRMALAETRRPIGPVRTATSYRACPSERAHPAVLPVPLNQAGALKATQDSSRSILRASRLASLHRVR